jgi:gamma-glutamylcyclotransferase (GGCT)/AIG2-like uncharacterized protein YtfP
VADHLFVYGTLAPGRRNEHVLAPLGGTWRPATVRGDLLEVGWGAEHGYPALALRADADEVEGLLFTAPALADHWDRLDAFEGRGYERVRTTALLADGSAVGTWVYVDRAVVG